VRKRSLGYPQIPEFEQHQLAKADETQTVGYENVTIILLDGAQVPNGHRLKGVLPRTRSP